MNFENQPPPLLDACSRRLLAQTPLHFACYTGDGHMLDTLIGNALLYNNNCGQAADACVSALVSEEDIINGWTPAHWAAFYGHLNCLVKLNVSSGLGFDTPSHRSNTSPLHLSAQSGSVLCLKWLLQRGSSKNRQDFMGETALHKAAKAGNFNCAVLLVDNGVSLDLKNHRGLTPADLAEQSNHTALAEQLRQVAVREDINNMTEYESNADSSDMLPGRCFLKQQGFTQAGLSGLTDLSDYIPMQLGLSKEDDSLKHSYIVMNGVEIHNSFPTDSCDMDQGDAETMTDCKGNNFVYNSSWNKKKRSFDAEDDDDFHSCKRKCYVPAAEKSHENRYGDACNNNIISSYAGVLAMNVEPPLHKTTTASPVLQQSSLMEHEASVVAQQGYDSTFMNTLSHAFH
ncbi:unnamed protein product [Candidula unifasciata]|uniref:Ankyrin repeat domain-containing protein 10 n=1 Tax=Candidula unifasciata TaxID=100452 RepID=A0A8S4A4W6_9EUPU|nr:unnamed protein product [Candidula unifasciata]